MSRRNSATRLLAEGTVILLSVLLALSADAWWASRQDVRRAGEQIAALTRDFEQMSERADSSAGAARQGAAAGASLLGHLTGPNPGAAADSAMLNIRRLFSYEVFSPSTGAYEGLIASGGIELIQDEALKRALADFFGGFEDLRVTEGTLLDQQLAFSRTAEFTSLIGFHRLLPVWETGSPGTTVERVTTWGESELILSAIGELMIRQRGVLQDYEFVRKLIDDIQALLVRD
jgi:hypothetical protein